MISCVAVDDEPLALDVLKDFISKTPLLESKGEFSDAFQAMDFLKKNQIDILFLDIQMPQLTGIQLLKSLPDPPLVIFTTAYSSYAVEGFNLDAIDFLLKPFAYERFLKAVNKASEYLNYRDKPTSIDNSTFIFIKSDYQIVKIGLDEILYIEGMDDYVKIFTNEKMLLSNMTMKDMLKKLPPQLFARVHRSFIVPLQRIESVRNKRIKIADKSIPVGDSYAEAFYKTLGEKG